MVVPVIIDVITASDEHVYVYLHNIVYYCQAQVQSQIQIQVPNPKSKVQRKGDCGTGADTIHDLP